MPTVAETYQVKRLLSDFLVVGGGSGETTKKKRRRVRFDDDNLEEEDARFSCDESVACSRRGEGGEYEVDEEEDEEDEAEEEGGEVDFVLSIGADGEWDYTIKVAAGEEEEEEGDGGAVAPPPPTGGRAEISRPPSPFAGCDRCLREELYPPPSSSSLDGGIDDERRSGAASPSGSSCAPPGLGNNLRICVDLGDAPDSVAAAPPMPPLITPPSSPRRIRTLSVDGGATEVATICEWPSNLAVDNAITAALELVPYSQAGQTRRDVRRRSLNRAALPRVDLQPCTNKEWPICRE